MNDEITILQLMYLPGLGARTLSKIITLYNSMKADSRGPLEEYIPEFIEKLNLQDISASIGKSEIEAAEQLYEEIQTHDIQMLIRGQSQYPQKLADILADYTPPVLFIKGNLDLLEMKSAGFCGSRNPSETAVEATQNCVAELVNNNIAIVSGYARGIDLTAHGRALQDNGNTIFVLPLGILNFQWKSEIYQFINDTNSLIISEFPPNFGWNAGNAMQRNNTIIGLSDAMVLVECDTGGGSFEAGKACLRLGQTLYVIDYGQSITPAGNEYFIRNGAKTIKIDLNNTANLEQLLKSITESQPSRRQKSLFDRD